MTALLASSVSLLADHAEKAKETGGVVGGVDGGLESALIDQRMRAERHKANFDALKTQHLALQEKFQALRLDHDTLADSYDRLHQKSQEIIQKLQSERDDKIMECENLRKQTVTGLRLEQLRLQLAEEIEEPFRKRTDAAETELESLRSEYNRLRYNCSFLKSQYDALEMSHKSEVEELTAKHRVELSALMEERKKLLSRHGRDVPTDLQRIRQLERDNGELQQRVKSLISENEEIQAEKELTGEQNKQNLQVHSRQLAELQALNKTLEVERTSLNGQTQSLQQELSKSYQQHQTLSEQLSQLQRQLAASTRKLENAEHKHSMDISEMEMKHVEHVRELEQERERCKSDHSLCQAQLETVTRTVQEQDTLLANKEQQVEQRVQMAREKEWEKQVLLEREKVEVEEKLAELQRLQLSSVEEYKLKIEKFEAATAQLQIEKGQIELELEMSTRKLQEKSEQLLSLNNEVQQLSKVSKKYQSLYTEHRSLQQSGDQLLENGKKMEETVSHLEGELLKARQEMLRSQEVQKQDLERERQCWLEEKETLSKRIEEWQTSQQTIGQKLAESKKEAKKFQKHYKRKMEEMRRAQDLQVAEMDRMSLEKAAAITALNLENKKLKGQLVAIQRKRKEFMFFLQHNPHTLIPQDQAQEAKVERADLKEMCQRMDSLEANQDMQLLQQNLTLSAAASRTNQQPLSLSSPVNSTHSLSTGEV